MTIIRYLVIAMLLVTVLAPILLYTEKFASTSHLSSSLARSEFLDDMKAFPSSDDTQHLNVLTQEPSTPLNEPEGTVYPQNSDNDAHITNERDENSDLAQDAHVSIGRAEGTEVAREQKSTNRVLSAANESVDTSQFIRKETDVGASKNGKINGRTFRSEPRKEKTGETVRILFPDAQIREMKDQLVRARVYLALSSIKNDPHLIRELRQRMKLLQRALGSASRDSQLSRAAPERMKGMEKTLEKCKFSQEDCTAEVKKLRGMIHSTQDHLLVHEKQETFLAQVTAKTLPKGLHCLPLRLANEYFALNASQREFPHRERLDDPRLFHYALFSDNVLAASVVVNSAVKNAKNPRKHVFHVVTDGLNHAAMRAWFLSNPPGQAAVDVRSVEEFKWLNASYSPVVRQLRSRSMIDYYFRTHRASSDPNLKYRNPKYLSVLNHLRFYLPEIFPKLEKVVFLDDDVVVQKDLSGLWSIDLKGNVNGAVETCGENFHRFDRYLNFSNPLVFKNFDPKACGWAYGMNVFDLGEWRKQNITRIYHTWQKLNRDRQLWKLGTLPPGLITFWKRTFPIKPSWHLLGLGYNPNVDLNDVGRAAVIHYNGNMKPWLEIAIQKYRRFWEKHVDYDNVFFRECNINP